MIVFNCSQAIAEFIEPKKAGPAPLVMPSGQHSPGRLNGPFRLECRASKPIRFDRKYPLETMPTMSTSPCRIYGIKNCDTMTKAFAWLEANGVAYEFIDYKKADVTAAKLPDWNQRAGWEVLLNKRGMMWKRLSDDERAEVDEVKALALMADYPTLIKRPVLDTGKTLLVGFDPERYTTELK